MQATALIRPGEVDQWEQALYAFLAENVRTHSRAGQARMRSGQIHLRRGDLEAASEVYELYLVDFPDGRRWQDAAYWAGRTRLELGDSAAGQAHLLLPRQPAGSGWGTRRASSPSERLPERTDARRAGAPEASRETVASSGGTW